jgi:GT2 family glycosyltransferase
MDSTRRLSAKYEVILVTGQIEAEKDAKQILLNMSKDKPNLTKTRLVLMDPEDDKGPASRRNLGALLAESSILLFADDDTMILDDINPLLEYLRTNKCQGIQPLLIRFAKPDVVDSAGDFIKKGRTLYTAYCRYTWMSLKDLPGNLSTEEVPSLRSAFMLVQKNAFLSVGGFDNTFFFNFEDVDLGWRMTSAGYKLLFVPYVKAQHKGSYTTVKKISDRVLRLELVNSHAAYLKITSYSLWLYIFAHFQQHLLQYEWTRTKQRKVTYISAFKDLFVMNKLFIEHSGQTRLHRNILRRKFHLRGRQKLEDMARGKRFIYQIKHT